MANIVRKTIVFNLDDPYQRKLYEHTKQFKNFSYYGKSLVQRDYETSKPNDGIKIKLN